MFGIEKDYQKLLEQVYGPLGEKPQMTEQQLKDKLPPDIIEIGGVKYQKVKEPEPKTLKELFEIYVEHGNWAQSKDVIAQELVNIVKEFIPERVMCDDEDYDAGHNYAIKKMEEKLK